MLCPLCNNDIHDDSIFCGKCGKKVPRCPSCGKVIRKRSRFCTNDGTPIPEEILALLPDSAAPAPAAPKPAAPERSAVPAPKSKPTQNKKKKNPAILIVIILLVVLALILIGLVGYIVWQNIADGSGSGGNSSSSSSRQDDDDDDKQDPDDEDPDDEKEPVEETAPGPVEETTPPTAPPIVTYEYRYEIIASNMSWDQAKAACEAKGGYLATITSAEELATISELASKSGLTYLWIGANLPAGTSDWSSVKWVTGEDMSYQNWYPGEPSIVDNDGTPENALCLWNAKYKGSSIGWTFNDQRNDLVGALPSLSGRVGYICEYRIEVTE